MKEIVSTITGKGQVTIPAEIRRRLGVKMHDKIVFVIDPEGTVRITAPRYTDVASIRGAAGSLGESMPFNKMREVAHEDRLKAKYEKEE